MTKISLGEFKPNLYNSYTATNRDDRVVYQNIPPGVEIPPLYGGIVMTSHCDLHIS